MQPAQDSGWAAVHVYTQQDGTYHLRIVVPRADREATIAALKEAGVERPLDQLQEGLATTAVGLFASVAGALGLKSALAALIKINEGKKVKYTSEEVALEGYSAKDAAFLLKELGLGGASEPKSDDTTDPT